MKKLFSLTLALSLITASACGSSGPNVKAGEDAAIACAHQDLGQTVPEMGMSLLMTVASILFDGGSNWQNDLAQLGAKFGPEALACAENIAKAMFKPAANATPATGDSVTVETPYDRAVKAVGSKTFK